MLLATVPASAAVPPGPRLALVELAGGPLRVEVRSVDANGGQPLRLAGGGRRARPLPLPLEAPSWSGDGNTLAFAGIGGKVAGSQDFVLDESQIFLVGADGSGLRAVPGTLEGRRPVLSPDGTRLAFTRVKERKRKGPHGAERVTYQSYSVWLADLPTGAVTQLTPWRNGLRMAADSFTPDGSTLAVTRRKGHGKSEVLAVSLNGGGSRLIARNASEVAFSPDGTRIAFLRFRQRTHAVSRRGKKAITEVEQTTDLFVADADGRNAKRLTKTPRGLEVWPSWDPSGSRLAVTRLVGGTEAGSLGFGDAVVEMNADGSCPTTVLTARLAAFYGATWQPGAGRGAGPISCSGRSRR
jgi:Tol biopolymer transport system component